MAKQDPENVKAACQAANSAYQLLKLAFDVKRHEDNLRKEAQAPRLALLKKSHSKVRSIKEENWNDPDYDREDAEV